MNDTRRFVLIVDEDGNLERINCLILEYLSKSRRENELHCEVV